MIEQVGRYQIIKELGRGGMATVYLANDPRFQREVAVKVLPSQFLHDPRFRSRFDREAQTIASLEHPAIVPVYDFGEENEQPYIVMRYMSGGSLQERIEAGPMALPDVIAIIKRVAAALDSAHQRGIIHRDLKPGNILFDQYKNAHLADFGIVKLAESNLTMTSNAIIGTPAYMSPEQAQGSKAMDGRTDVYALGILIFEMLTGQLPFYADTPLQQLLQHVTKPVPRILDIKGDLPPAIEQVVAKALAKSPDERFQSAVSLALALDKVVDGNNATNEIFPKSNDPKHTVVESGHTLYEDGPETIYDDFDSMFVEPDSPLPVEDEFMTFFGENDSEAMAAQPWNTLAAGQTVMDSAESTSPPAEKSAGLDKRILFGLLGLLALIAISAGVYYATRGDGETTATPTIATQVAVIVETPTDPPVTPTDPPTEAAPTSIPVFVTEGAIGGGGNLIAYQSQQGVNTWSIWAMELDGSNRVQLTDEEGNDERPRWSPDGGWIAFTSDRSGNEDIWLVRPDGSELTQITTRPEADYTPQWSPDGKWLSFHAEIDGKASLFKVAVAEDGATVTGEPIRLTQAEDGEGYWPSWSPDGERLTFWSIRNGPSADLYVMDADGGNQQPILQNSAETYLDAVWSPVSDQIAYYAYGTTPSGRAEIYTIGADSITPQRIETGLQANAIFSDWSPDGEWMVLHTDWHGSDEIYRVRVDGSEQVRLTKSGSDDRHPTWQPNGRLDVDAAVEPTPSALSGELVIWSIFPDDGETTRALDFGRFQQLHPGITIETTFIEQNEMLEAYRTAFGTADAPDLVIAPVDWAGGLLADGLVQDPTGVISAETLSSINPKALAVVNYVGNMTSVPFVSKGIILMRNKALIPDVPSSFDDILALDSALYDLERGLYYSGATLNALGGQLLDGNGQPTFANEAGTAWLSQLAQFKDATSYGDEDIDAFAAGEIGLVLDATWNLQRLANAIGADNMAVDPWPEGLDGWVLADVVYVNSSLAEGNGALVEAFVGHLLSAETQSALAQSGRVPVTANAQVTNPTVRQAATALNSGSLFPIAPEMAAYWSPLSEAIDATIDRNTPPEQALQQASDRIKAELP